LGHTDLIGGSFAIGIHGLQQTAHDQCDAALRGILAQIGGRAHTGPPNPPGRLASSCANDNAPAVVVVPVRLKNSGPSAPPATALRGPPPISIVTRARITSIELAFVADLLVNRFFGLAFILTPIIPQLRIFTKNFFRDRASQ
jgi:hypothetical protein